MHNAIISAETVSLLYLVVLLFSMLRRERKRYTSIAFIACLGVAIFGIGTDLLSFVLESTSINVFWLTLINMLSFLGYDFELMTFAVYVWTIVAEKEKTPSNFVYFISAACVADIIFVIVGTVTGQLFRIENSNYVTGPWYILGGVVGFIVLVSLLVFTIKKRRTAGRTPTIFVVIFFVITYASMFITLLAGIDSYLYVCMALVMMLVYIILQTGEIEQGQMRERIMFEMSTTDILTKLNNRRAFENALTDIAADSCVSVVFCDVNGLKVTNDNLGHAAGDALLLCFAELLREHFMFSEIFRISGDEFVVLRKNVDEKVFLSDMDEFRNAISARQDIASIGYVCGNGSNVLELVTAAEKEMYADKKAYYERHGIDRRRR